MDILFRKRFSKAVDKTLFQNLARERGIRTIRKTIDYSRMNRLFETYSKEGGGEKNLTRPREEINADPFGAGRLINREGRDIFL